MTATANARSQAHLKRRADPSQPSTPHIQRRHDNLPQCWSQEAEAGGGSFDQLGGRRRRRLVSHKTDSAGLIHVITLNDPSDPDGPGESAIHAQDLGFEGSQPWAVSSQRPEVVLQSSMTREPLYAKAGVLDEGKSILRNLHTATFDAVAEFR